MPQEVSPTTREHYSKFSTKVLNEYHKMLVKQIIIPLQDSTPEQQAEFRAYLNAQLTIITAEMFWRTGLSDNEPTETIELDKQ